MVGRIWFSVGMLAVGAALLVVVSVAWSAGDAKAPQGGTLRIGSLESVDVDPAFYTGAIGTATCATLFRYPAKPGAAGTRVVPEVVETSTKSSDGRTYSFELKRKFRFHTGAPVIAQSFAAAFNRVANPQLESPAKGVMREIVGAVAVMEGKAQTISGVRALDRYRLQIRLTRPVGDFTARLTMPFFCPILPNTRIVKEGINNPAGSGPYYVAERIPNRLVVLKRNPFYRGGRPANVDQMDFTIGETAASCLSKIEQDQLDTCFGPIFMNRTITQRLAEQYGINQPDGQFFRGPLLATPYLAFNHDRLAFKGPGQIALKKAINYAIDRTELLRAYPFLSGTRSDQMLPPELGRDTSIYPLRGTALKTARKWYARAKIQPQTLVFYAPNNISFGIRIGETLKFNLKQIGIELDVRYFDIDTRYEKVGTLGEPFDIAYNNWAPDWADPAAFFEVLLDRNFRAKGNTNLSYFVRPWVTRRMGAASRLPVGPARRKAWADLDADLMRRDPPWAPISHHQTRMFVSPSYGCFLYHTIYGLDLAAACKKK